MPTPYSDDLRWRIVWLRIARDMEPREIADLLCIGESTVRRYTQRFYETGSVSPTEYHHGPHKLLDEFEQVTVMQSLLNKPSMYLTEVCDELFKATGREVHPSTICRTIHSLGFTRQKLRKVALQQSEEKRGEFLAEMAFLDPSMFVWLDETGSDRRNNIRHYGYGLRGITPVDHQLRIGGNRVSAIGVMSMRGVEDVYIHEGTVNGDVFEDFVRTTLLPTLQPFNGTNSRSVVVLDNASIHHLDRIQDIITSSGALIRFLPPYSPDLMPLEEVFSKVKYFIRANEHIFLTTSSPRLLIAMAFASVTPNDCISYIRHAGYIY